MGDYIVRATAAGGQVRAFAATTKGLVEEAKVLSQLLHLEDFLQVVR